MAKKYDADKPTWVLDTEIYRNYLLIGFKNVITGKVKSVEVFGEEDSLSEEDADWVRNFLARNRTVGFNSKPFDLPIIYMAIEGYCCRKLKQAVDDIIVGGMKSWDVEDKYSVRVPRGLDHIDLIEVAPGKASLKIYNGRLHGKRMQDLPIDPDATLTEEDAENVYDYWKNDLAATELLFSSLKEQIQLRTEMSEEFDTDLRSKSDAQVAEAVIKHEVKKLLGQDPVKPDIKAGTGYAYNVPAFIEFYNEDLIDILDQIGKATFRLDASGKIIMPDFLKEADIRINGGIYRMGIGGLHSSEKRQAVIADKWFKLVDRDVTSYYPYIIINQGLHPKHLGWAFLKVYKKIVMRRVKAKEDAGKLKKEIKELEVRLKEMNDDGELSMEKLAGLQAQMKKLTTMADSLKITINGSFGKFGSKWSVLFSPQLLIQTTITGQLSLLMLIDWLEDAGIEVVSANTDGIVIKVPRDREAKVDQIVKEWEEQTGFGTEATEYKALYSRDVNNYIAVKPDGECKTKGAYAKSGFQKNPQNEIVNEAVSAFLSKGTPIKETIRGCEDIRKFVTVRSVTGGAVWGVDEIHTDRYSDKTGKKLKNPDIKFDMSNAEYLGKSIRWYYSREVTGAIHYKKGGNKVPRSDGARPLMELPDDFPRDVDFRWYEREAIDILHDIGYYDDMV